MSQHINHDLEINLGIDVFVDVVFAREKKKSVCGLRRHHCKAVDMYHEYVRDGWFGCQANGAATQHSAHVTELMHINFWPMAALRSLSTRPGELE